MERNEYIEKVRNKLKVYCIHVKNVNLTRSQKSRLSVILMLCMFIYLFSIQTSQSNYSGAPIFIYQYYYKISKNQQSYYST